MHCRDRKSGGRALNWMRENARRRLDRERVGHVGDALDQPIPSVRAGRLAPARASSPVRAIIRLISKSVCSTRSFASAGVGGRLDTSVTATLLSWAVLVRRSRAGSPRARPRLRELEVDEDVVGTSASWKTRCVVDFSRACGLSRSDIGCQRLVVADMDTRHDECRHQPPLAER